MKVLLLEQIAKINYKYSYSLVNALVAKGVEVEMVIDYKKEEEGCFVKKYNLFACDEKNISKISKLINYIQAYLGIGRILEEGSFNIIHTQWMIFSPLDYLFIRRYVKKYNLKLVMTVHDIMPFNRKFYDYYFHKKMYTLADYIIVQAENNVSRMAELFPGHERKTYLIPHGHFLEYAEPVDWKFARDKLGIDKNKTVFLFFGQIKKVKGVGVLLEAIALKKRQLKNCLFIIAGSVWKDDFSNYQKIIDENQLDGYVRTEIRYIPDEDIKLYYSAADVCVLPYLDVYQSGVIQLCYAYKKPVIATSIGAFKEIVQDGANGFLCEPNSPESLSDAIERALEHSEQFSSMGEKGYELIKEKYSWEPISESICKLYEE